jgi:hypothetical protein
MQTALLILILSAATQALAADDAVYLELAMPADRDRRSQARRGGTVVVV